VYVWSLTHSIGQSYNYTICDGDFPNDIVTVFFGVLVISFTSARIHYGEVEWYISTILITVDADLVAVNSLEVFVVGGHPPSPGPSWGFDEDAFV